MQQIVDLARDYGTSRPAATRLTLLATQDVFTSSGDKARLLSTDPPYCVQYTGANRPIHDNKPSGKDWSHVYREVDIADLGEFLDGVFTATLPHVEATVPI